MRLFPEKERFTWYVRVIELVFQRTALLDGQGVGLPAELISHLMHVAAQHVLVANISGVR